MTLEGLAAGLCVCRWLSTTSSWGMTPGTCPELGFCQHTAQSLHSRLTVPSEDADCPPHIWEAGVKLLPRLPQPPSSQDVLAATGALGHQMGSPGKPDRGGPERGFAEGQKAEGVRRHTKQASRWPSLSPPPPLMTN